jgi:hypothetical protein
MKLSTYSLILAIVTCLSAIALFTFYQITKNQLINFGWLSLLFLVVYNIHAYFLSNLFIKKFDHKEFGNLVLGLSSLKLFFSVGFIIYYYYLNKPISQLFVLYFFALYVPFTILEVYVFSQIAKSKD